MDSIVIGAETSQKCIIHLVKSIKADDCEYFMKASGKETNVWPQKIFGKYFQTFYFQLQHKSSDEYGVLKEEENLFGDIIKYKDCSCVYGGMQKKGLTFTTYLHPL